MVEQITDHIRSIAGGSGTNLGTGGMSTKLLRQMLQRVQVLRPLLRQAADQMSLWIWLTINQLALNLLHIIQIVSKVVNSGICSSISGYA